MLAVVYLISMDVSAFSSACDLVHGAMSASMRQLAMPAVGQMACGRPAPASSPSRRAPLDAAALCMRFPCPSRPLVHRHSRSVVLKARWATQQSKVVSAHVQSTVGPPITSEIEQREEEKAVCS